MFYSHTFLARKGPLGTVWCAAHLQHKLRKSHYIATNVPSTVDRIMSPEVPIALRMSGHLLLGVVRIYSKQVDYLYEDCNEIRITINRVFTTVNVNLPHDATHAPPHSVTLPEKLDLDALNLDDYYKDLGEDSHLKSLDEITLTDQIPTEKDPYIIIRFDMQDFRASSLTDDNSETGATPMDEDVPPPPPPGLSTPARSKNPSSSNQAGPANSNVGMSTPQSLRSVEVMRDAAHGFDFNNSPILPDRAAPDRFLEEQINKDKEHLTLNMEEIPSPVGHFSSPRDQEEEPQPSLGPLNSPSPFDLRSPEMEIQQSPPLPEMEIQQSPPHVEQPRVQRRRRRRYFDETTVLSNSDMNSLLNDTKNICRRKRDCPSSSLDTWRLNKRLRLRKEDVSVDPFINGACVELQAIHGDALIESKKVPLSPNRETRQETNAAEPHIDSDVEIEVLRNNEYASPERGMPPPFMKDVPSSSRRDFLTPENSNVGLQSERMETTGDEDELLPPTAEAGPSGNLDSGMETPDTFFNRDLQDEHTALSDIPELVPSAGDLGFLDQDDNSPTGLDGTPELGSFSKNQGTPELQSLSSRTRAVAQYLKKQSSVTPILENSDEVPTEKLSLSKILEGKPRKICARMFFETLVLSSHGLVKGHQIVPYEDITLEVTDKLSKGKSAA